MTTTLVVVLCCLIFEAFCSGSEMAVVSLDRVALRRRAAGGHTSARLLEWFLDEPLRLLATTLVGTNLAVVVATVTVTSWVVDRGFRNVELVTVALLSPVLLVLGETVPKTIARKFSVALAPRLAYPLRLVSILFMPFVAIVGVVTRGATRLFHLDDERALVTREELQALLRNPGASKDITEGERRMVQRIFRFGDTTVYDVMVPLSSVFALAEDASLDEACREIQEKNHTRIPLFRERVDQVVSVLHSFDLLKAGAQPGKVSDLGKPALFFPESAPAVDVLKQLQRERQGIAVVVDEYGGAIGIVTIEDILEEIVGDIEDEHDRGEPVAIRPDGPGIWRVRGRAELHRVNAALGVHLPEGEDYETVAGLLLDRLKRIPREGEALTVAGTLITILAATDRMVDEVRIQVLRK